MADLATPGADAFLNGTSLPATLYMQLHTGDPGASGLANVATLSTRISVTPFTAAAAGAAGYRKIDNSAGSGSIPGTAGETISHVSYWSAAVAGTCWFIDDCGDVVLVAGQGISLAIGAVLISVPVWV